ncbi:MAG: HAD family hydrolase [Aquabacterium sp.]
MTRLALFDLDHTLLDGDSDVLWCDWLMDQGVLDRDRFEPENQRMEAAYKAGQVTPQDFCGFYVASLAGRTPHQWQPLREAYMRQIIAPRLGAPARALVRRHLDAGDTVVLTTATNRFLTELTAAELGIAHLIATECETDADGRYTGRIAGVLNMREGKPVRLQAWRAANGLDDPDIDSVAYSDSINDLPLLLAARRAVAVDPDAKLRAEALARGWAVLSLRGAVA